MNNPMQLIQILQMSRNPQATMQQMLGNNPAYKRAMEMAAGKSPEQLKATVTNLAAQQGIDINQLQQMAGQMGIRF